MQLYLYGSKGTAGSLSCNLLSAAFCYEMRVVQNVLVNAGSIITIVKAYGSFVFFYYLHTKLVVIMEQFLFLS